jgi:hypothetical protein
MRPNDHLGAQAFNHLPVICGVGLPVLRVACGCVWVDVGQIVAVCARNVDGIAALLQFGYEKPGACGAGSRSKKHLMIQWFVK